MTEPKPTPTSEQSTILAAATSSSANLMINALAGTGKSTTLEMIEGVIDTKPILYIVFGAKNAEKAAKKMLPTTTVRTANACGHRVWAATIGKNLIVNGKKSQDTLRKIIDSLKPRDREPFWEAFWPVIHGVALAKALGYVPEGKFPQARRLVTQSVFHLALEESPDDFTADLIDLVLFRSIQDAYQGHVDFNDQVYMPAVFGGIFPRFPTILVDEYQDLNPTNHALIERLFRERLFGVGDPQQSIYGFRGASAQGMYDAQVKYSMTLLDLSTSFRCPRAIVEAARWRVPNFKWIKEGGHVETLAKLDADMVADGATFLCRNNAPLFALAFRFLSAGRSIRLAGSDIGPKLVGILRKLGPEDLPRPSVISAIADWQAEREAKNNASAKDMAECMRVLASHGNTLGSAIAYAEHLFAQKGSIQLMTGHKAKGLEWPLVYHLDPYLLRLDEEQDQNLAYVIQTRSMDRYFEVASHSIQW